MMDSIEKYNQEILNIANLLKSSVPKFKFSNVVLFREYQSRLFQWKTVLNTSEPDYFNKKKSYHNLFLDLDLFMVEKLFPEHVVVKSINDFGFDQFETGIKEFMGFFLYLYLNWEIYKDSPQISKYNLESPYLPLLKIFTRGGLITFFDNKFVINDTTYLKYHNIFRLPSIDDNFLNFIDYKSMDFPNQIDINLLWQEFADQN